MPSLPDRYDPSATESEIYARWIEADCFHADADRSVRVGGDREPFTIVIPPPNVTAVLHMGHGLNNTIQDVLIRWARMCGAEALWVPGTDHAGIATQNVVEKLVAKEGLTRFDLGREAFVCRTEQFVKETGGTILEQLRSIGASADWSRTAYTLSPELSRAVREAFVRLHERGLIYKGYRIIHWCPRCLTSLSDEEAEFVEETGKLYRIRYASANGDGRGVMVATTRPETMLGDVAVAVNPDDDLYRDIVGKTVTLPIVNIQLPVIADGYADPAFGTGVVKITPAHDANDFEVGKRHALPMPIVIDETGAMGEGTDADGRVPAELRGVDRFVARERIVAMLRASGALVSVETHQHSVRHCYRCDTVVEPRLSDQWWVKMEPLARPALQGLRDGSLRILPERWEAVYVNWLEGIRDWNISRQLWWGHRIPVWYCDTCPAPSNVIVSRDDVTACPNCRGPVRQDPDVLDTWFSSWLWPFSTLGWPNEESRDLAAFYPTDVLVTAPEILFFWVARMIMSGYAFMGREPFKTVYLHGTVRDTNHVKMSKSLGNGIDPLDVVRLYGADALRWTMVAGMGLGADVILDPADLDKSFATGRNFATKLWNIGRFILGAVGEGSVAPLGSIASDALTRADHWILSKLDTAVVECDDALGPIRPGADGRWMEHQRFAGLRLNEYAESARRFVWNDLADWYVEAVKTRLSGTAASADREVARAVLVHTFDHALRLLHPIVPFITEALWQKIPGRASGEFLIQASWPMPGARGISAGALEFELVREAVLAIRQIRSSNAVAPSKRIDVLIVHPVGANDSSAMELPPAGRGTGAQPVFEAERPVIERLTRSTMTITDAAHAAAAGASTHAILTGGSEVVVPLAGLIDVSKECDRMRAELDEIEKQIVSRDQRLSNAKYVERAPPAVVAGDRAILAEMRSKAEQLRDKVRSLCGD